MGLHTYSQMALVQIAQVSVVAIATLLIVRFLKRRPHLAHALLLVVLIKCIIPPVITSPLAVVGQIWSPEQREVIGATNVVQESEIRTASSKQPFLRRVDSPSNVEAETQVSAPATNTKSPSLASFLLGIWLVGALVVSALAMVKLTRGWRLIRQTLNPASGKLLELFEATANGLGITRPVRLLVASKHFGPFSHGVFSPVVVLPKHIIKHTSHDELRSVLSHELIHVRRRDAVVALLQTVVSVIWWFHPLIWYSNRILSRYRELCCDEQVLASTGCDPENYANGILAVLKEAQGPLPAFLASGIRPVDVTKSRLEAIMLRRTNLNSRTPLSCWLAFAFGLAITIPGVAQNEQGASEVSRHASTEETNDDAPNVASKATKLKVSDEEIQQAVRNLEDAGGRAILRRERTDPKHWVQIILDGSSFNDDAMDAVRLLSLDARTHLHLRNTAVTFRGLDKLKGTRIEKLALSGELIDDKALKTLPGLAYLEELSLESTTASDVGVKSIVDCKRLNRFAISEHPQFEGMELVLVLLKELPDLTELSYHRNLNEMAVEFINELPNIESLSVVVSSTDASDAFNGFRHLDSLKELTINGESVDDATLSVVGKKALSLKELYIRGDNAISNAGLKSVGMLSQLEVLSLSRTRITEIESISQLKRLRWLDLMGTGVSDTSLKVAASLPLLEHLMLVDTNVTEAGLEHLISLEKLNYLRLERTYVKALPEWMKNKEGLYATVDRNPRQKTRDSVSIADNRSPQDSKKSGEVSLDDAVNAFNLAASRNPIGKFQEPLTVDEVIAAIRAWNERRNPVDEETLKKYREIASTRRLPKNGKIDFTTAMGRDGFHFDVWWVDLTVMTGERKGYTFRIRDRRISSSEASPRR